MDKKRKIMFGHIAFLVFSLVVIIALIMVSTMPKEKPENEQEQESEVFWVPPVLNLLTVDGEEIGFSSDVIKYNVLIPEGNPIAPKVEAVAAEGVTVDIYQAFITDGKDEFVAKVFLDDGKMTNEYEVTFVQDESKGFVLQYDDKYEFLPDYELIEGEVFTFTVGEGGGNITVSENGIVSVIGVSDNPSTVNAYVGDVLVDTLVIDRTTKAVLDIFVVAGQGNAAGEGGNAEESDVPLAGTAYTVELNDRNSEMKDLSVGRKGFTPSFAKVWYSLTGEKSLYIQTALSDVSVTKWTSGGEAYILAAERLSYFEEKLNAEDSFYVVNRVVCLWLQGEWDISTGMTAEDYMMYFNDFHTNMKDSFGIELTAIIPARSSLVLGSRDTLISSVCAAQYQLANSYNDIIIATRLAENASMDNGFILNGNLYYSQMGYNAIGKDSALNVFGYFGDEANRSVKGIEVFVRTHENAVENGGCVELRTDERAMTVAVITPLYAKNAQMTVEYDKTKTNYLSGGQIFSLGSDADDYEAEMIFKSGDKEFKLVVSYVGDHKSEEEITYRWDFDALTESNKKNDLVLSQKSVEDGYTLSDGNIVLKPKTVDFTLTEDIKVDSDTDWSIEWSGTLDDNGIIFGNEYDTKGFIYLAPYAEVVNYSIRMVDKDGKAIYLPYGDSAQENKKLNTWKIEYRSGDNKFSLYLNGECVSSVVYENYFEFNFTNVFGRYGSDKVNYCYSGTVDYIAVSIG